MFLLLYISLLVVLVVACSVLLLYVSLLVVLVVVYNAFYFVLIM